MNILKSLGDVSLYQAGGRFDCSTQAACNANFPALKHFFPFDEADGSLTITDRVGGVVVETDPASPIVTAVSAKGTRVIGLANKRTPAFTAPGTKKVLILGIAGAGSNGGTILQMGIGDDLIRLATVTGPTRSNIDITGTTQLQPGYASMQLVSAELQGWALGVDWAGDATHHYCTDADAVSSDTPTTISGTMSAGISTFGTTGTPGVFSTGIGLGNVQVLHFTSALPSATEIRAALSFMRKMQAIDPTYKFVYPGFLGRS